MTDRLKHGTKYPQVEVIPKKAKILSAFAKDMGFKNPAYVCVKYDRWVKGESKVNPGYKIVNCDGFNYAIPI